MREGLTPLTLKVFGDGFVTYVLASGEAFIVVDPALCEVVERALMTAAVETAQDVVVLKFPQPVRTG